MRPLALRAFYERVRGEQPQVLVVTGDIGESDSVARFVTELADIAPIYFVLGNHDYYRSSIATVRAEVQRLDDRATWLPALAPLRLSERTVMLGVDGWGDARCGDLESKVELSDWTLIDDFRRARDRAARIELLQRLGGNEARVLRERLADAPDDVDQLLVLTHVPPFPEACIYHRQPSQPARLPWVYLIAAGRGPRAAARP